MTNRHACRFPSGSRCRRSSDRHAAGWARLQWTAALSVDRRCRTVQPCAYARRAATSRTTTTSTARLYSLFLDADRQYSCAYFETPDQSLDDAQLAKKRHIARQAPGRSRATRVLDIGSGWGGLGALSRRDRRRRDVTGVTLSRGAVRRSPRARGRRDLGRSRRSGLQDYRDITEQFDRIVSVGMFEHVGVGYYDTFFEKCAQLAQGRRRDVAAFDRPLGRPRHHQPVDRQIHLPRRLHPGPVGGAAGDRDAPACWSTDIEILRLHYAETLKLWRERFLAHREDVESFYDERFVRMWEFYLAASEMAFREQNMMVFQIQLTKRQGVVPITRDYISARKNGCAGWKARRSPRAASRGRVALGSRGQQVRQALSRYL